MKILIITNLFPNQQQPDRGVFNKQQFMRLAKRADIRIVAPLPWVPESLMTPRTTKVGIPDREEIEGIPVYHPRYFVSPKIGRCFYGQYFYWAIKKIIKEIEKEFAFDVVLGTWAYPDGFAAAKIAKDYNKPFYLKVHGTDINVVMQSYLRRRMIKYAMQKSNGVISVTKAMRDKVVNIGIEKAKVHVIPNGVDKSKFKVLSAENCRQKLGLNPKKFHIVFIGNLTPIKGIDTLIKAMVDLPDHMELSIVGGGEKEKEYLDLIKKHNLTERIFLKGKQPHQDIPVWMNAAHVFCLPSLNEGCPNVILEALTCGTPVVASRVGGIPEIIDSKELGLLVPAQDSHALATALKAASQIEWNEKAIAEAMAEYDWDKGVDRIYQLMKA